MSNQLLTRKELSQVLKTNVQYVVRMEKAGNIKAYRLTATSRPRYVLAEVLLAMGINQESKNG